MEKSGTADQPQNPKFAILGLSHIRSRCPGVSEWSSLSVSCFGGSNSTPVDAADNDERTKVRSPRPTRQLSDDAVARKLSAKVGRRRFVSSVERQLPKPLPPPPTTSTSLQVPAVSFGSGRTSRRPSEGHPSRNSLASESMVICPLRRSSAFTSCSTSPDWPWMRRATGSRSRSKAVSEPSSRRDVLALPSTTVSDPDDELLRGTSTTKGRHLDVFLPSLVARQTVEPDDL